MLCAPLHGRRRSSGRRDRSGRAGTPSSNTLPIIGSVLTVLLSVGLVVLVLAHRPSATDAVPPPAPGGLSDPASTSPATPVPHARPHARPHTGARPQRHRTSDPGADGTITDAEAGEQSFIVMARTADDFFASASDEQIVGLGHSICTDFDNGQTYAQVGVPMLEYVDARAAGTVIGSAIAMFCPEHDDLLH